MTVAICASFAQISFQIFATVSHFQDPKQSNSCSETFEILRQFGFEALSAVADKLNMARLLLPEIVALIATSVAYVVCAKLPSPTVTSTVIAPSGAVNEAIDDEGLTEVKASNGERSTVSNHATIDKVALFASRLADVLTALLLALAAEIYPSLPSAIYFLSFLGLLTVWASHRPIHTNSLDRFRVFVMAVSSFHLFFLYLYQVICIWKQLVTTVKIHLSVRFRDSSNVSHPLT